MTDVATEAQHLQGRIFRAERSLATAYPEEQKRLQGELKALREQYADLEPKIEDERVAARERLEQAVDDVFQARDALAKLNGHSSDPGFASPVFAYVAASTVPGVALSEGAPRITQDVYAVREALLEEIEPRERFQVPEVQATHEERLRNERAGHGYFTDAELARREQDPVTFDHGEGARVIERMSAPVTD